MKTEHGWSQEQVNSFAKKFATSDQGRAWHAYVADVRSALLTEFIMLIAAGNERAVTVNEAFALVSDVSTRLNVHHNMRF